MAALTTAIQAPASTQKTTASQSYALAASRHAPGQNQVAKKEPENRAKKPASRPTTHKLTTTITLTQKEPTSPVFTDQTTPRLPMALNNHLATKKGKVNENSKSPIKIKSIQRHASNYMVVYLQSQTVADSLQKQANNWLPTFSTHLIIRPDTHAVLVHGIPTTFNPQNPEHLEDLIASNGDRLSSVKAVRWMNTKVIEEEQKHYSSIIILLTDRDAAHRCVKHQIWYRYNRKRTELGRQPPTRCFNCLKSGHSAAACPNPPLCPYCGDDPHAHTCSSKGKTPTKRTSCAREKKKRDVHVNLKNVLTANPTNLLHSPFDPKCEARQVPTPSDESTHTIGITTEIESNEMMINV